MGTALLEIGAVARQLGVAPSTLRTWERRYRLVIPHRGAQGQRLYDRAQIDLLGRILAQVQRGARARAAHAMAGNPVPVGSSHVRFEPSPEAPLLARRALDELIVEIDNDRFAFYLRLVASELVKNAVLYGSKREPIELEATLYPDWVDLQVENRGGRLSMTSLRSRRRYGGRGLEIVGRARRHLVDRDRSAGDEDRCQAPRGSGLSRPLRSPRR